MALVYKCDICGAIYNKVYSIHGIAKPYSHKYYEHLKNGDADCCELCYNLIMKAVEQLVVEEYKQKGE